MRYALRRLLILPLMLVFTAVVSVLLPVVGAVQAIVALGVVFGRRPRWRAFRLWVFAAVYCVGECLCLLACLLLWLASPVPRWRDGDQWRARHVQVLSWYLGMLMHTAERVIAFRLKLECPRGETMPENRPVIVLGPAAGCSLTVDSRAEAVQCLGQGSCAAALIEMLAYRSLWPWAATGEALQFLAGRRGQHDRGPQPLTVGPAHRPGPGRQHGLLLTGQDNLVWA